MTKQKGLGKGLHDMGLTELLSSINKPVQTSTTGQLTKANIISLFPGKYQPRRQFNKDSLEELAQSIKSQGIIQPLIVRAAGPKKYEIIAGERRWRAAQLAGLKMVPVVIKEIADEAAMAMGLIENMQREDLNAIDLAQGLDRLINEFELTHQSIADVLGKSRTAVTNTLRLLQLEPNIQDLVKKNQIEMGHARTLLSLPSADREIVAASIMKKSMSVRAAENFVRNWKNTKPVSKENKYDESLIEYEKSYEVKLRNKFGKNASLKRNSLTLKYSNLSELEDLLAKIF